MTVHSILPDALAEAAEQVLVAAGIRNVAHGTRSPMKAAEHAASDPAALALLGPYRSADIAEAVEATAPKGLALIAPVATWVGVTRDDEPGCDDPAQHRGTVLRLVARDSEVAARIAADVRSSGRRALVIAGEHFYGVQLDHQLRLAGLPRTEKPEEADLVILAGLQGEPEIGEARASAPLPLVAFDGAQGAALGDREVHVALPYEPVEGFDTPELLAGVERAQAAAKLVTQAFSNGATDRPSMLSSLRRLGGFDAHGDLPRPPVWLWRAGATWEVRPDRPL